MSIFAPLKRAYRDGYAASFAPPWVDCQYPVLSLRFFAWCWGFIKGCKAQDRTKKFGGIYG